MDTDTIDPRAVKIMSDILALTIDDQDGVALSALSRIRRRARESAVTGGGLKEAFRRLVHISGMVSPEELDHASSFGGRGAAPAMVGRLTSQVDALRSQLAYAEQLRLQDAAAFVRRRRRDVLGGVGYGVMIGAATIVLAGVAVWAVFPAVRHPPHRLEAALDFRPAMPETLPLQEYPADAARRGDQGMVTLALSIGPLGDVTAAQLARSSGSAAIDEAARQWAWSWRFRPAEVDGQPIASTRIIRLRFGLAPRSPRSTASGASDGDASTAGSRPLP
jgi:TonB family protein